MDAQREKEMKEMLSEELDKACNSLTGLAAFLNKGSMSLWHKTINTVIGGCGGVLVVDTGVRIIKPGEEDNENVQLGRYRWKKAKSNKETVHVRTANQEGKTKFMEQLKGTALPKDGEEANIRKIILEQVLSWRKTFMKAPVDLSQPTLMEAFSGVDCSIITPSTLTVEFLEEKWGTDFLARIVDVSIDTEGGIEPGLISLSLKLQQRETCESIYVSLSIMTLTAASVLMVSEKLLNIFGKELPLYSWGGDEHTLFSGLRITDIQTKKDGLAQSLVAEFNRLCGENQQRVFRKDFQTRMNYFDDWNASKTFREASVRIHGTPNAEAFYLAILSENDSIVGLCVADTMAILRLKDILQIDVNVAKRPRQE